MRRLTPRPPRLSFLNWRLARLPLGVPTGVACAAAGVVCAVGLIVVAPRVGISFIAPADRACAPASDRASDGFAGTPHGGRRVRTRTPGRVPQRAGTHGRRLRVLPPILRASPTVPRIMAPSRRRDPGRRVRRNPRRRPLQTIPRATPVATMARARRPTMMTVPKGKRTGETTRPVSATGKRPDPATIQIRALTTTMPVARRQPHRHAWLPGRQGPMREPRVETNRSTSNSPARPFASPADGPRRPSPAQIRACRRHSRQRVPRRRSRRRRSTNQRLASRSRWSGAPSKTRSTPCSSCRLPFEGPP